tara:strand:- start:5036 stop:6712 length:1677 start_codon:yes stop_codon:yes gene_type:complete
MTSLNLFDCEVNKFDKYTQIPFTEDKLIQAILYRDGHSRYNAERKDYDILPIEELFNFINADDIVEILCQKPVTDLMEAVEIYNDDIQYIVQSMKMKKLIDYSEFRFALTKNFNWKAGTYPFIHKLLDYFEGRYMRASGIDSLFKRRLNNEGYLDSHRVRLNRLDKLRATAKRMVGSKESDASEYKERMLEVLETINENTLKGNKVSDKIKFTHYFTTNGYSDSNQYTFLDLWLITKIDIAPMDMYYTKNNDVVFHLTQPAMTTFLPRPLYKVLNNDVRGARASYLYGYSQNKHAYLQDYSMWERGGNGTMHRQPWSSVCLSEHGDGVIRTMGRHNYAAAAHNLTLWGSSYSLEHTNPYNGPNQIAYEQGIPEILHDSPDDIKTFNALIGFSPEDCYNQRIAKHRHVFFAEEPLAGRIINDIDYSLYSNLELYGDEMIDECVNCPIKEDCYRMSERAMYYATKQEWGPIVEALIAEMWDAGEFSNRYGQLYWYIHYLHKLSLKDYDEGWGYIIWALDDKTDFFKEPLTAEEQALEDARIAQLNARREMEQWAIGGTNG